MNLVPIIFDSIPDCLRGSHEAGGAHTLLTLPLGTGTVLRHLIDELREIKAEAVRVLAPSGAGPDYADRIRRASGEQAEVVTHAQLSEMIHQREPADYLLLIDPAHWPVEGYDFDGIIESSRQSRWAVHAVAAAAGPDGLQEFVRCDDRGHVRRIRRYYDRVTSPQTGTIPYSLVTVAAIEDLPIESLAQIRSALVGRGMLSQDLPLCSGVAELTRPRTLLALAERFALDAIDQPDAHGYILRGPGVLTGTDCDIDSTARLIGPIVVQRGAKIGPGAIIIGPTVIGASAVIEGGCRVVQSLVGSGVMVRGRATVRHGVIVGDVSAVDTLLGEPDVPVAFLPKGSDQVRQAEEALRYADESRSVYPYVKRAIDFTAALLGLAVLSPILIVLAVLVKLDSRGPLFFAHEREGKDGKVFKCVKFRTMSADAHLLQRKMYNANNVDGPQFKMDNDPRVTRVGRILRATNLDELPQLFNVLVGQMSLIGPRPSPFRENQICVPWRRARLSVRPGITGLWQVCRHDRSQGDFHQWIAYDTLYVRNLSFLVDLKVLLATLLTLGGKWNVPETWIVPRKHVRRVPEAVPAGPLADAGFRRTA
jgi:lipopolysaccharide/colanic/teichoic acid biosynthesis glycosyltransferase